MIDALVGARVRRLDAPLPRAFALELSKPDFGTRTLLVGLAKGARGVGLLDDRPRGRPASGFVRALRPIVEGATIVEARALAVGQVLAILELTLERAERAGKLVFDFACDEIYLVTSDGRIANAKHEPLGIVGTPYPRPYPDPSTLRETTIVDRGAELYASLERALEDAQRRALAQACASARKKLERRRAAVLEDASRVDDVPQLRHEATLIVSHLHAHVPGTSALTVLDWTRDPPETREIAFDRAIGPRRHADALFARAKRMERGLEVSLARLDETEKAIAAIVAIEAEIAAAPDAASLTALGERAAKLGVRGAREAIVDATPKRKRSEERRPYRSFRASDGGPIWVGRGAADNDALTMKIARPHDLFLHARGHTGAHVIVPLEKTASCPADRLVDAATLAAHFSSARGEALVEIVHAPRRYLRKPRGSATGAVLVDREKVMLLRLEPDRLARLLASED